MIDFEKHPFRVVRLLIERTNDSIELEFSRYIYTPQQLFDQRHTFHVAGSQVSIAWFQEQLASLGSDEEIALHSKVTLNNRTYHIPID